MGEKIERERVEGEGEYVRGGKEGKEVRGRRD